MLKQAFLAENVVLDRHTIARIRGELRGFMEKALAEQRVLWLEIRRKQVAKKRAAEAAAKKQGKPGTRIVKPRKRSR